MPNPISSIANSRWPLLSLLAVLVLALPAPCFPHEYAGDRDRGLYQSPYGVKLPYTLQELIPDLLNGERGDPRLQSDIPYSEWYSRGGTPTEQKWGPHARQYPAPALSAGKPDEWKRARVIATALRFVGYHYRHHHLPDWDPPPGWYTPKPGEPRHDGKGVDCSNFTSFVYNQGLGVGIPSGIRAQIKIRTAKINASGETMPITVIPRRNTVEEWKEVLKPGDLLFIRPRKGSSVSHVVIWVGEWGTPPGGDPLIIDSHNARIRDAAGKLIPEGVYMRPFKPGSWYAARAAHAIRIIGD